MEQALLRNLAIICICLCTFGYLSLKVGIRHEQIGIADPTPINKKIEKNTIEPIKSKENIVQKNSGWVQPEQREFKKDLSPEELAKIEKALNSLKKEYKSKEGLLKNNKESLVSNEFFEFSPSSINALNVNESTVYNVSVDLLRDKYRNTTNFKKENGSNASMTITLLHQKDSNFAERNQALLNKTNKDDIYKIYKEKPIVETMNLTVKFFQWDVNYDDNLGFPKNIAIVADHLDRNYICKKVKDEFLQAGTNYIIEYDCPELPNIFDYKNKMKVLLLR